MRRNSLSHAFALVVALLLGPHIASAAEFPGERWDAATSAEVGLDHPQLQGERRAEDLADLGLPLFYDVER